MEQNINFTVVAPECPAYLYGMMEDAIGALKAPRQQSIALRMTDCCNDLIAAVDAVDHYGKQKNKELFNQFWAKTNALYKQFRSLLEESSFEVAEEARALGAELEAMVQRSQWRLFGLFADHLELSAI